jgi:hypothetical protein
MINDPSKIASTRVPSGNRALLVERRSGILPDHILDGEARKHAINLRIPGTYTFEGGSFALARDITRMR